MATGGGQTFKRSNVVAIIGGDEYVTVDELVEAVIAASGKDIHVQHVEGPVGVHARNFDKSKIKALGWEAKTSLREGIATTYSWIEEQVRKTIDDRRKTIDDQRATSNLQRPSSIV